VSTSSPAQLYATLVGAVLVIAGIIGFFYSANFDTGASSVLAGTDDVFGILGVNGWHNVVHILLGLLGLACAASFARSYALGVGLLYIVLAIWGFADSDGVILGLVPLNDEDNVLHLILGLTGLGAGAASPATGGRPATT
jgi:ABC-type sulfate transport system permease component